MAIIEQLQEFAESLRLPSYPILTTVGEAVENALAVVGFNTLKEMQLMKEFIDLQANISATIRIFEPTDDRVGMIDVGAIEEALPQLVDQEDLPTNQF